MNHNPIFPLTYEDLRERPKECIAELARFLQVPITDSFIEEVIKACDFENLQTVRKTQNQTLGKIYRKGIVGDWANWLSDEQSKEIDDMWQAKMTKCFYKPRCCFDAETPC
ncbi:hypothetical protein EGW08_021590 [Elysia chlorotica]|uniref:Sulfotransferase domain-containing protein n=1 Tax=Elysia chlorotica TaxID=188477 RepID=A0A3S1BMR1_ELYCH|nr:hypothetical protein EGW08_021590 [Elysia chlorotica]